MQKTKLGRWMTALLAICSLAMTTASAAEAEVRDAAGLFSASAVKQANEQIRAIRKEFRKDLVVETFSGVPEGKTAEYARNREAFFTSLVNERATAARVDGIYVLVMKELPPHRYRIQVGVGQATRQRMFPTADRDGLVRAIQDRFREDKFDEGLLAAVGHVERALRSNSRAGVNPAGRPSTPAVAPASSSFSFGSLLGLAVLAVGGLMVVSFLLRMFRGGSSGGGLTGAGAAGGFGGRGGFLPGLLGGIGGALAGSWLYDQFFGGNAHAADHHSSSSPSEGSFSDLGGDYSSSGGDVDFGGDGGGGDFGGGGGDV